MEFFDASHYFEPKILMPPKKSVRVLNRKQIISFLFGLTVHVHSSYLCRRVLPLIDCELEQVLGGSTGDEETSGAGALFKVSCLKTNTTNFIQLSPFSREIAIFKM